jgi:predicted alpha/beta hydrolase family esterase
MLEAAVSTPVLIVPGYTNSGPEHWHSRWERALPNCSRVEQRDWEHPVRSEWEEALAAAIRAQSAPPVLVAHSLGCLTVAHWASGATAPVRAALLVAPPDVEQADTPAVLRDFAPVPLRQLSFPSILVASGTDP